MTCIKKIELKLWSKFGTKNKGSTSTSTPTAIGLARRGEILVASACARTNIHVFEYKLETIFCLNTNLCTCLYMVYCKLKSKTKIECPLHMICKCNDHRFKYLNPL